MRNAGLVIGEAVRLMNAPHSFGFRRKVYLLGRNVGPGTQADLHSHSEYSLAGLKHVSENIELGRALGKEPKSMRPR